MKRIVITTLGLAVAVALWGSVRAEEAKDAKEPAGKKLFLENKCNSCHSIDAAGIEKKKAEAEATDAKAAPAGEKKDAPAEKTTTVPAHKPPDLSSIGIDQTSEWMGKFLKKEVAAQDGKKHMKLWKGTDEDLKTLTAWLGEQKAEKKDAKAADAKAEAKPADDAAKPADDAAKPAETKAPETETK